MVLVCEEARFSLNFGSCSLRGLSLGADVSDNSVDDDGDESDYVALVIVCH